MSQQDKTGMPTNPSGSVTSNCFVHSGGQAGSDTDSFKDKDPLTGSNMQRANKLTDHRSRFTVQNKATQLIQ